MQDESAQEECVLNNRGGHSLRATSKLPLCCLQCHLCPLRLGTFVLLCQSVVRAAWIRTQAVPGIAGCCVTACGVTLCSWMITRAWCVLTHCAGP